MPTKEKAQTIEQAKDWYSRSVGVVFADYRGLSVKEVQGLRRQLREKGADFHVVKNTLFRIAAGDDVAKLPDELHNGPTAIAFVFENESEVTKSLLDYTKAHKSLKVKGGFFGGQAFDAKQVEALSNLPPIDVLRAQVIGAIAAPLSTLVGTIEALYADPIRTIGAVADKVAERSPAPAKAEAPAAEAPAAEEPAAAEAETAAAEAVQEPELEADATNSSPADEAPESPETPTE